MSKGRRNRDNRNIRLSPKHGVNPTIPVCFWCGKKKNEIALLGRIGDGRKGEDIEAPRSMVLNYDPCDECEAKMNLGVACIEVTDIPMQEGMPELVEGHYPTGRWNVIIPEAAKRIFEIDVEAGKKLLVSEEAFTAIFTSPIMDEINN